MSEFFYITNIRGPRRARGAPEGPFSSVETAGKFYIRSRWKDIPALKE